MTAARGDWIQSAEAVSAIASAWDETCAGNRNEDACESCRVYAEAIRAVEWVRDRDKPPAEEASANDCDCPCVWPIHRETCSQEET